MTNETRNDKKIARKNRLFFEKMVQQGDEHDSYDCHLGLDVFSSETCECRCHHDAGAV